MNDIERIVARYVALWNEPHAAKRRRGIAEVWSADAIHCTPSQQVHGYAGLETRIADSHKRWVLDAGKMFEPYGTPEGHHGGISMRWAMRPAAGGPIEAVGFDFFVLDDNGRIRLDYRFIEAMPAQG